MNPINFYYLYFISSFILSSISSFISHHGPTASSSSSSYFGSLLTGSNANENIRLKEDLAIIREELQSKIKESEQIHIQVIIS